MEAILLTIHVITCILLIIVVLLQSGKSADLAGAFGGAGSQSTFGPRGAATILSKATTTLAIIFMAASLLLYIVAAKKSEAKSVLEKDKPTQEQAIDEKAAGKKEAGQATETDPAKAVGEDKNAQEPLTSDQNANTDTANDNLKKEEKSETKPADSEQTKKEDSSSDTKKENKTE